MNQMTNSGISNGGCTGHVLKVYQACRISTATIQDAIVLNTTKLSKIIGLKSKCNKDRLLFEIRICFDKQFKVINCPNVTNSTVKLRYPSKPSPAAQALRCDISSNGQSTSQFLSLIVFLIAILSFLLFIVWTKFGTFFYYNLCRFEYNLRYV